MSERHPLAVLRRWLIDSAALQRMAAALLFAVLAIAAALVMLEAEGDGGRSEIIEIENPSRGG